MANMSEAFGNITIFCASFDALVDLIQCHLKYEKEVFNTFKDRILALLKEHETSGEAFGDSEDIYDSFDDCLYNIGDNGIALLEDMGLD